MVERIPFVAVLVYVALTLVCELVNLKKILIREVTLASTDCCQVSVIVGQRSDTVLANVNGFGREQILTLAITYDLPLDGPRSS